MVERLVEVGGARDWASIRPSCASKNFIKTFPHQTPVIMTYDAGDYRASLKKALELADYKGFGKRKRESRAPRQAARHRLLDLYRGLRHRAVARRSARSAPASACGNPPRCGSTRPARSRCSPARTATARATRPPSRSSSPSGSASRSRTSAIVHGDTDKVQFGMGTYGSRSGAVGMSAIVKALDKVEAKAKKVAAHHARSRRRRHRVQGRQVHRRRHRQVGGLGRRRAATPISRTSSPAQELEPGLKEGAFYDPTNFTFPAGCHICEVEIDPETGETDDRRAGPRSTISATSSIR